MFGSEILEVAIGVIFVFLLVAVICSAVREGLEAWLKTRSAYLERGIRELMHDHNGEGLAGRLYRHPLIASLYTGDYKAGENWKSPPLFSRGGDLPSYLPKQNIALALMDIAARGPNAAVGSDGNAPVLSLANVRAGVVQIENEAVQRVMLTAIDTAQGDIDKALKSIEDWYDSGMDRVSGWYKRTTQWILFGIGIIVAVSLNINTITIADYLYRNGSARDAIVAQASNAVKDTGYIHQGFAQARASLDSLNLPMGWDKGWGAPRPHGDTPKMREAGLWNNFFGPILGWLITAFAATVGAPFWFDLLNKMMVVRATVKPKEKSPDEGSEDRQPKKSSAPPPPPPAPPQPIAPQGGAVAAGAPVAAAAQPASPQTTIEDGCDVPISKFTPDHELPPAQGGVR